MAINFSDEVQVRNDSGIYRGIICKIGNDGSLLVSCDRFPDEMFRCDILRSADSSALTLRQNDPVIFVRTDGAARRGCVLGKVGKYKPADSVRIDETEAVNDKTAPVLLHGKEIEIRADSKLLLRCGEGSLSISRDGTIIIRGSRILSRSKGTNKIKGASVQIN